jgi:hypothetical protein
VRSFDGLPTTLGFGERFRVKSRSGNAYVVRFLVAGEGDGGVFVRLDSGEIARLDPGRLEWSTCESASDTLDTPTVKVGDDLLLDCPAGPLVGKLAEELGGALIQFDNGLCVRSEDVKGVALLFRAPELRVGDRFRVKSHSGGDYAGQILKLNKKQATVRLASREEVLLRLDSLDVDTLYVEIPVPRSLYRK